MDVQTTAKSERLTVLLSRDEKRSIESRARAADLSVGEFMRRAGQSYEPDLTHATLERLVDEFASNIEHMRKTIADTLEFSARCRAERAAMRKARHGAG